MAYTVSVSFVSSFESTAVRVQLVPFRENIEDNHRHALELLHSLVM